MSWVAEELLDFRVGKSFVRRRSFEESCLSEMWINLQFLLHRGRSLNQSVYIVQGNDRCILSNTQKYTVCGKYVCISVLNCYLTLCPFQWPLGLRRGSATVRLLGLRGSIPSGSTDACLLWMLVLSGGGLCVRLITRPEESYRVWCVWVWSWSLDNDEALAH